jgi:hypothetical protein
VASPTFSLATEQTAHIAMARKYLGGSGEALTIWISVAASTVLVFYGYDQVYLLLPISNPTNQRQGVFGNVLVGDDFLRTMSFPSTSVQGTLTSVYNLGCFFGALSTIITGDILGRPRVILLGSSIIAIGAAIQASSYRYVKNCPCFSHNTRAEVFENCSGTMQ